MARSHSAAAIETLVQALKDPRLKVQAAEALLSRGWGRPLQSVALSGDADAIGLHLLAARAAQLLEVTGQPAPTLEGRVEPANSKASTLVDLSAPPPTE